MERRYGEMSKINFGGRLKKLVSYLWHQVIFPNLIWTAIIGVPSAAIYVFGVYKAITSFVSTGNIPMFYLVLSVVTLIINAIIFIGGVIYLIYYFFHKKNMPKFPELTFDYRVTSSEYELFFESREKIIQTQCVHLEALNDNLKEVSHNMTWTGQKYGKSVLDVECTGVTLIDTDRTSAPYPVKIKFEHPLRRGDQASYKFSTYVEDTALSMMPFLSKIIKCQTEKLVIRVTAPRGMIKNPYFRVTTDSLQDIQLDTPKPIQVKCVGHYELYEVTVTNLELLRCYSICWEFT